MWESLRAPCWVSHLSRMFEQLEARVKAAYVPKLRKVLPAKKVARYLQVENKIRAVVKYDLAAVVPLAQ